MYQNVLSTLLKAVLRLEITPNMKPISSRLVIFNDRILDEENQIKNFSYSK